MGYAGFEIPALLDAFPEAIGGLRHCRPAEIRDSLETLLYIYTAQNISCLQGRGQGVAEQSCFAYTSGPLVTLLQLGLIEEERWPGVTAVRTTPAGERISRPLMEARVRALRTEDLLAEIPVIVPILMAGNTSGGYVNKAFPASLPRDDDTFVDFLLRTHPPLFDACERFARRLMEAGCAAPAHAYDADGVAASAVSYVFPAEFAYILKEMLEQIDPDALETCGTMLDMFCTAYTVLRYLETGDRHDEIAASPALRDELTRVLGEMGDAVQILEPTPMKSGVDLYRFIIKDRYAYEARLHRIRESLAADAARKVALIWHEGERRTPVLDTAPLPEDEEECPGLEIDLADCWIGDDVPPEDASCAPFPRAEPPAKPGSLDIFLGYARDRQKVFWSPGTLNNGHMIIIGGSGAGKTETIRCIAQELLAGDLPVVMIDFHGDMACRDCAIRTYKIREGSRYYFNPLELDSAIDEITPLRATSDFVDAISINFPTLGIQQRRKIKNIIKDCYRMAGITGDPDTWSRVLDFDAIENGIMECEDEAIPAYLEDIFDYKLFSGDEKISIGTILAGGITHINLNALPENLRYLFADLFLRRLYYSLQAMGEIPRVSTDQREKFRLFVIVDEAKLLVSQKSSAKHTVKAVLNKYATEMRKFGVSLILASQLIGHFNDEILANIAVKFCMRAENKKQAQENARFFEVGEKDLMNFSPGEGILIIGSEKLNVRIVPAEERNYRKAA